MREREYSWLNSIICLKYNCKCCIIFSIHEVAGNTLTLDKRGCYTYNTLYAFQTAYHNHEITN